MNDIITPWYTPKMAARRLGVHKQTIYRMISTKQIRALKVGKQYRISAAEMALFLEQNDTMNMES